MYGYEYASQSNTVKEKMQKTCMEKYGVTNGGGSKEVIEKIKQTNLEKYGCEYYFQADEFKNKAKNTLKEKYGIYHSPKSTYIYQDQYFDSFPELCIYSYCIENNIEIRREPIELSFIFEGKEHHYYPDFKINNKLIEVKGNQFLKEDGTWNCPFDHALDALYEAKHQCALKNNVKILYKEDYKKYIDWFYTKYKKEDFFVN